MGWIVGVVAIGFAFYLWFLRKSNRSEIIVRVEPSSTYTEPSLTSSESLDEEKDNWERFDFYAAKMVPAVGKFRINYVDQRGLKTERDIQVKRVHDLAGQYAIDAHCLLRNGHRSFINERISRAVNLETGEIVENVARDAVAQYAHSGEAHALSAINSEWMGVAVLIFVCRADGQMRKDERLVVAEYLSRCSRDQTLDASELDKAIKALGEPDHREFKRIIRDLKSAGEKERLRDLLDCAHRIVGTQKRIAPMETAALEILSAANRS